MLELAGVTRVYRAGSGPPRRALDDVTLRVERGASVALVGENGSGKSTLLRVAATVERPDAGAVRIGGVDPRLDGPTARAHLGYLAQDAGLYDALTVRENLLLVAAFHARREEVAPTAERLGIRDRLDDRALGLSRGERQRAAIARALLGGDLVLLDEPTTALDEAGRALALSALEALRGERTVLVATHDAELAKRCGRRVRIHGGRLA